MLDSGNYILKTREFLTVTREKYNNLKNQFEFEVGFSLDDINLKTKKEKFSEINKWCEKNFNDWDSAYRIEGIFLQFSFFFNNADDVMKFKLAWK